MKTALFKKKYFKSNCGCSCSHQFKERLDRCPKRESTPTNQQNGDIFDPYGPRSA